MKKHAKITPVTRKVLPRYPDQYSVELKPLLLRNKPLRWQAAPAAGMALSAVVLLGLAGCGTVGPPVTAGSIAPPPDQTPFFEHGKGIGVYGCVSVAAPIFFSEDDAFAIIRDEFSKSNLIVEKSDAFVSNVQLPKIDPSSREVQTQTGTLNFDFEISGTNIVMEYVSSEDIDAWATQEDGLTSSVTTYNYIETARTLNDSLNHIRIPYHHGVFYNPSESKEFILPDSDKTNEDYLEESREKTAETLREQVKDFIAWLSAQGII